jgi:hypothetical protein
MIADFQAHAWYLSEKRRKGGLPGYIEMTRGILPPQGTAGLTEITHSAESLRALKTTWEAEKQAGMERWRVGRAAKKAVSSSRSSQEQEQPS